MAVRAELRNCGGVPLSRLCSVESARGVAGSLSGAGWLLSSSAVCARWCCGDEAAECEGVQAAEGAVEWAVLDERVGDGSAEEDTLRRVWLDCLGEAGPAVYAAGKVEVEVRDNDESHCEADRDSHSVDDATETEAKAGADRAAEAMDGWRRLWLRCGLCCAAASGFTMRSLPGAASGLSSSEHSFGCRKSTAASDTRREGQCLARREAQQSGRQAEERRAGVSSSLCCAVLCVRRGLLLTGSYEALAGLVVRSALTARTAHTAQAGVERGGEQRTTHGGRRGGQRATGGAAG